MQITPTFIHIRHTTIYDYSITVYNCVILHAIFNLDTLTYVSPVSDGDPMYKRRLKIFYKMVRM